MENVKEKDWANWKFPCHLSISVSAVPAWAHISLPGEPQQTEESQWPSAQAAGGRKKEETDFPASEWQNVSNKSHFSFLKKKKKNLQCSLGIIFSRKLLKMFYHISVSSQVFYMKM